MFSKFEQIFNILQILANIQFIQSFLTNLHLNFKFQIGIFLGNLSVFFFVFFSIYIFQLINW